MKLEKKHSFWLGINYTILLITSFINIKINLINFGDEVFGIWILFTSLWGIGSVLDFGLGISITKYIAQNYSKDNKSISRLITTSALLFLIIGIILFFVLSIIGDIFYLQNQSILKVEYYKISKKVFYVLGLSFLMQYFSLFFKSVLEGFNNFLLTSRINIWATIFIFVATLSVWLFNLTILHLALLYLITFSFVLLIYIFYYLKTYQAYRISIKLINLTNVKEIFSFSFSVQLTTIIGQGIDPLIKYLLSSSFSVSIIPAYEIARKISSSITGLFHSSFRNLLPNASYNSDFGSQREYLLNEITKISRYAVIYISFLFGVLLWVFPTLIMAWFQIKEAALIFLLLAIAESINGFGYSIYIFFFAIGKVHINFIVQLLNLLLYSSILILSINYYDPYFGFIGYAFSTLIGNILMLYIVKKYYRITFNNVVTGFDLGKFGIFLVAIFVVSLLSFYFYSYMLAITLIFSLFNIFFFYNSYNKYLIKLLKVIKNN